MHIVLHLRYIYVTFQNAISHNSHIFLSKEMLNSRLESTVTFQKLPLDVVCIDKQLQLTIVTSLLPPHIHSTRHVFVRRDDACLQEEGKYCQHFPYILTLTASS
jgi:hypothetical protein